jgi:hypothetical protein
MWDEGAPGYYHPSPLCYPGDLTDEEWALIVVFLISYRDNGAGPQAVLPRQIAFGHINAALQSFAIWA